MQEFFGEVIFSYTRKEAIEDGVLVDVSEMAKEAGIKYPVAVTRQLWEEYIVPDEAEEKLGQSIEGRLWDLLVMFTFNAKRAEGEILYFGVGFYQSELDRVEAKKVKAVIGPGDQGEPVITIMLPHED